VPSGGRPASERFRLGPTGNPHGPSGSRGVCRGRAPARRGGRSRREASENSTDAMSESRPEPSPSGWTARSAPCRPHSRRRSARSGRVDARFATSRIASGMPSSSVRK
jgi:hypothetical protein